MATLVSLKNVTKSYEGKKIFADLNFNISENQKIGVFGPNGAGKSTLFKLITGLEEPDRGQIEIMPQGRLGFLAQHENFEDTENALQFLMREGGGEPWEAATMAHDFEFTKDELERPAKSFSAGERMRLRLSAILLKKPNLILLDEPTNYLDLRTQLILERFLKNFKKSFLIISHDREFLEKTADTTLEICNGKITFFAGKINQYTAKKAELVKTQSAENRKLLREIDRMQNFVDRFRATASKAEQAQSKIKGIARLKKNLIDINVQQAKVKINLRPTTEPRGSAWHIRNLAVGYEGKTIADGLETEIMRGDHIVIAGNNGEGKSTLLKTLSGHLSPTGGSLQKSAIMRVGVYNEETIKELPKDESVEGHLIRKSAGIASLAEISAMCGDFLFSSTDRKKPISVLSGGEKSRVALAGILLGNFDALLLDEPTNHLDLETVEALGEALEKSLYTVIVVTHNRTFARMIGREVIEVKKGRIRRYPWDYSDYIERQKNELKITEEEPITKVSRSDQKVRRQEMRERLKVAKKELKEKEEELSILERKKQKILEKFTNAPTTYLPEETRTLREISEQIEKIEDEWVKLGEEINSALIKIGFED